MSRHPRARRRVVLAGLSAYALVLAIVAGPLGSAGGEGQPPELPRAGEAGGDPREKAPGAVAIPVDSGERPVIPTLPAADAAAARALLEADPAFRRVVGDRPYRVEKVGPWTTSNGPWTERKRTLRRLGAAMLVSFAEPVTITAEPLPTVLYDVTERNPAKPYQEADFAISASRVPTLHVMVDLRLRRVVNLSPGPGSSVQSARPPAGFRREVPDLSNEKPPKVSGGPAPRFRDP